MIKSLRDWLPRTGTARRRAVLVAVAWLNVVTSPCAMAFGDDHRCPHAGSAAHAEHASGHAGHAHHAQPGAEHHHAAVDDDCGGLDKSCCEQPDAVADARAGKVAADDGADGLIAAPAIELPAVAPLVQRAEWPPPPRDYATPPIHALNCVYLD